MKSPPPETSRDPTLAALIAGLASVTVPVTFLDAMRLVREVQRYDDIATDDIAALVALYDAPHLTDGARTVLQEFLGKVASQLESEYALARRPVLTADSGKRARLPVGETLLLRLDRPTATDRRWQMTELHGPITCQERMRASVLERAQTFDVGAIRPGRAKLLFSEEVLAPTPQRPHRKPGGFELYVLVEPRRRPPRKS